MPNILYLHGFASGPRSEKGRFFHSQFAVIGAEVHQPDLAEGNFRGLTIKRQLEVVDQQARRLQPALVIGSSLGGYLAALYAASQPKLVPALVLLAPTFGLVQRWTEQLGEKEMLAWKENGFREVYHYGERRMAPIGYQFYEDALWFDEYPAVTQPTLIFHGRRDDIVEPRASVEFSWGKPNVQLELVDSDHQLLDVLPDIWDVVSGFYQNLEPLRA